MPRQNSFNVRCVCEWEPNAALCDSAPVYQKGGSDGPVLYRSYQHQTQWRIGPSSAIETCAWAGIQLSAHSAIKPGTSGDVPTAVAYSAGDGRVDWERGCVPDGHCGTITVVAGGGR